MTIRFDFYMQSSADENEFYLPMKNSSNLGIECSSCISPAFSDKRPLSAAAAVCHIYAGRTRAPLGHQENIVPLCGNLNASQLKLCFVIQFKAHFLNSFTVINSIYNCHEVNKKPYTHHLAGIEDSSLLNISSIIDFFIHDVLLRKQER